MRVWGAVLIVALELSAACSSNHSSALPTAPTPTPPPPAAQPNPGPGAEKWNLSTTFRSFAGPEACVSHYTITGVSHSWLMESQRSDQIIHLIVSDIADPTDRYEYDGTVVKEEISASTGSQSWRIVCGEAKFDVVAQDRVSGRFSVDGGAFEGDEIISSRSTSGDTLTFHYDWIATRQ